MWFVIYFTGVVCTLGLAAGVNEAEERSEDIYGEPKKYTYLGYMVIAGFSWFSFFFLFGSTLVDILVELMRIRKKQ